MNGPSQLRAFAALAAAAAYSLPDQGAPEADVRAWTSRVTEAAAFGEEALSNGDGGGGAQTPGNATGDVEALRRAVRQALACADAVGLLEDALSRQGAAWAEAEEPRDGT